MILPSSVFPGLRVRIRLQLDPGSKFQKRLICLDEVSTSTASARVGQGRRTRRTKKTSYKHVPHCEKPPQVSCKVFRAELAVS